MRIIYVGTLEAYGTCFQRMAALRELGHEVIPVDVCAERSVLPGWLSGPLASADYRTVNLRIDLQGVNRRVRRLVHSLGRVDLVWFDKPLSIGPRTLRYLCALLSRPALVAYSPDDQLNRANHSKRYLEGLPYYDVVFTTKQHNLSEVTALGAQNVRLARVGFDPRTHRPVALGPGQRERFGADVSFVGTYEYERGEILRRLAEEPFDLKVWGNGWKRMRATGRLARVIQGRPVYGDDYAKVICASKVNLAFLRKVMRDTITTRSVEIPACGGFMLAERTQEHLRYFEEDKEAAYFGSYAELVAKLYYYLERPLAREAICKAARMRCLQGKYSNHDCLAEMLAEVTRVSSRIRQSATVCVGACF